MRNFRPLQRMRHEQLERRHCLSTIGFSPQTVDHLDFAMEHVADLNGDGHADLVGRVGQLGIGWRANLGEPLRFGDVQVIDESFAGIILTLDIDRDGDDDILHLARREGQFVWYENRDGRGTFTRAREFEMSVGFKRSVLLSDLNGDDDLDIVVLEGDGSVVWYPANQEASGFGTRELISSEGHGSLATEDLDHDGDQDLVVSSLGVAQWFENLDGLGTFLSPKRIVLQPTIETVGHLQVDDVDQDGRIELIFTTYRTIEVYTESDQPGVFQKQRQTSLAIRDADYLTSIRLADADGDGDLDLFITAASVSLFAQYSWSYLTEVGYSGPQQFLWTEPIGYTLGDLTGDGGTDVVHRSESHDHYVLRTHANRRFREETIFDTRAYRASSTVAADLDGDDNLDIVTASWDGHCGGGDEFTCYWAITWNKNLNGSGTFGPSQDIIRTEGQAWTRRLETADLDGDGDVDLLEVFQAWEGSSDRGVAWYENLDGRGSFSMRQVISAPASIQDLVLEDLDFDGHLDLVYADLRNIYYRRNDGAGAFSRRTNLLTTHRHFDSIWFLDFDQDGDRDIVGSRDLGLYWFERLGKPPEFGPEKTMLEVAGFGRFYPIDLDLDGDIDVLHTTRANDGISNVNWVENKGDGIFASARTIVSHLHLSTVYPMDLDHDGDLDLLIDGSERRWYEHLGDQIFAARQTLGVGWQTGMADLDGDDDLDVFGAYYGVSWFENRIVGDVNRDGRFDSADLVQVFQMGDYEDVLAGNVTFDDGDWNDDGVFDSTDLVAAFRTGHYVTEAVPLRSHVAAAIDSVFANENQDSLKRRAFVA